MNDPYAYTDADQDRFLRQFIFESHLKIFCGFTDAYLDEYRKKCEAEEASTEGEVWPTTCAQVQWDMGDMCAPGTREEPWYEAEIGDLLWNPKGGDGHLLVARVNCGEEYNGHRTNCGCEGYGKQPCPCTTLVCECGEDGSWRDHHYYLLARKP